MYSLGKHCMFVKCDDVKQAFVLLADLSWPTLRLDTAASLWRTTRSLCVSSKSRLVGNSVSVIGAFAPKAWPLTSASSRVPSVVVCTVCSPLLSVHQTLSPVHLLIIPTEQNKSLTPISFHSVKTNYL